MTTRDTTWTADDATNTAIAFFYGSVSPARMINEFSGDRAPNRDFLLTVAQEIIRFAREDDNAARMLSDIAEPLLAAKQTAPASPS